MKIDPLIKMANEISAFFHSEEDHEQASRLVATHLRRYWEPRMRKEIIAYHASGGAGLNDIALRGVQMLAEE